MENQKPDTNFHSLSLLNMSFAFVVLGIGIGLAGLVFIVERVYCKWKKARNQLKVAININQEAITPVQPTQLNSNNLIQKSKEHATPIASDDDIEIKKQQKMMAFKEEIIVTTVDIETNKKTHNKVTADPISAGANFATNQAIEEIKQNIPIEALKELPNLELVV